MSTPKPRSRTKADKPAETRQLSTKETESLESLSEAEHQIGTRREKLTDDAEKADGEDRGGA